MRRYFKHYAESDVGEGVAYMEITDRWPSRQVEIYGKIWRWADEAHNKWLADQPFEVLGLGKEHEIQADEFEQAWEEALRRCPPHS